MDPAGLSMENFDAIGRWRIRTRTGGAVDASGGFPDGATFNGMSGLRTALLAQAGAVRRHADREAADLRRSAAASSTTTRPPSATDRRGAPADDYRFSSLVLGIVSSAPFQMRMTQ